MSDRSRYQLDWDVRTLHAQWPTGPDDHFLLTRVHEATLTAVRSGRPRGRILEVGAAEGRLSRQLAGEGFAVVAVDPSIEMLSRAKARAKRAPLPCVRGVAEELPLRSGSFDVVLCDSALDHMAAPDEALREMTRVVRRDGHVVIGFVNYGGITVRLSRLAYSMFRALRIAAADRHFFWDSPVPWGEHTFECTYPLLRELFRDASKLEAVTGISIGWAFPGWGRLLSRLPAPVMRTALRGLDAVARAFPPLADYVVTVWRPLPRAIVGARAEPPRDDYRVRPSNPVHSRLIAEERRYWSGPNADEAMRARMAASALRWQRRVLDDVFRRGPFRRAAMLGSHGGRLEKQWLERGAGALEVFDLTPGVLRMVDQTLTPAARARCVLHEADLNFIRLPEARYDLIWSFDTIQYVANLEHLFAEVHRALRPGGLFAFVAYVGEPRLRYSPARIERLRRCLHLIGIHDPHTQTDLLAPAEPLLSPQCAVRSDAILPLARDRFKVLHEELSGGLFPLPLMVDLDERTRDHPSLQARLEAAEREALADPAVGPAIAYMVLGKRPAVDG